MTDREGILNGLSPWKACVHWVSYDEQGWVVADAEGSISAYVIGGEEMAVFIAEKLNELALSEDTRDGK